MADVREVESEQGIVIVGIGASAGGLQALESFFAALPVDTGAAFVVLQHLSPDFESLLDELLGRQTELPVQHVVDGVVCRPNHVYVSPPNKEMIISGGRLLLTDRDPQQAFSLPIDHFFRSLAQDAGPRSVAVVLSGTGSDGARGVRDVHEAGGLVIVQTPDTARFDSMPRAAQTAGPSDLVLDCEAMGEAIRRHILIRGGADLPPLVQPDDEEDTSVYGILGLLRKEHGIDFSGYKPNMVRRRIARRLALDGSLEIEDYAAHLREHPEELDALYQDLLIGVTGFFRDPEAFAILEREVVAGLVQQAATARGELRIWVPGCATGEEAYSIGIVVDECLREMGDGVTATIFATDVHHRSLEIAAAGCYPEKALSELSDARRARYFHEEGGLFRVRKELRQRIVFARQNVIKDAPFTRLDLISCRNLLIYLEPNVQKKVLSLFHFGLRTGGVLMLGMSETPGPLADEFEVVDSKLKLFRKRRDIRLPLDTRPRARPTVPTSKSGGAVSGGWGVDRHLLPIYDALLSRHMPPSLLVGEGYELLHAFGGAEKFLRFPSGRTSLNLLDVVQPELKTSLSGALQRAEREGHAVRYNGIKLPALAQSYSLKVEPLVVAPANARTFLVSFELVDPGLEKKVEDASVEVAHVSNDYIQRVENELRYTKENLQATIEELETSNEELQATNEELVAANEELQSTNEELHSVNEELYSVNAEHQKQIVELTELTNDMDNLLHSTDIGIVFLDAELKLRKFTARAANIFHLLSQDVGRSFDHFIQNVQHPNLIAAVRRARDDGGIHEGEVRTPNGEFFFVRVLPYKTKSDITGVVLTLVDIGALKQSEANVKQLSALVQSSADAVVAQSMDGLISAWNDGAERMFGYAPSEVLGQQASVIVPEARRTEHDELLERVAQGQALEPIETVRLHKSGRELSVSLSASPIRDEHERLVGASSIIRDISRRKRAERRLRQAMRQRDQFIAQLSHELRNPLMALLTATDLLGDDDVSDSVRRRATHTIDRQTKQMARILEDLLDVSRMRRDRIELRREVFDLREVVPAALDAVRRVADDIGVLLERDVSDEPVWVHADRGRIVQAVVNLVDNAIKYTPAGRTVRISVDDEAGRAVVRIADEGTGISQDVIEDIFEPFHQGDEPLHGGERSMGLGLALVQSIASAHGGDVQATSDGPQKGSTFELRLLTAAAPEAEAPKTPVTPSRRRLLLVEDQEENRLLLGESLSLRGYDVTAVGSGGEALDLFGKEEFSCALVDIGLPDMSGLELASAIRSRPTDGLRLIALTGHGRQQDREAAFEAGFDEHLVKPIDLDDLVRVLEEG